MFYLHAHLVICGKHTSTWKWLIILFLKACIVEIFFYHNFLISSFSFVVVQCAFHKCTKITPNVLLFMDKIIVHIYLNQGYKEVMDNFSMMIGGNSILLFGPSNSKISSCLEAFVGSLIMLKYCTLFVVVRLHQVPTEESSLPLLIMSWSQ